VSEICVTVAWGDAAVRQELALQLPAPATLRQALDAAAKVAPSAATCIASASAFGVWGKVRAADYVLRESDRVEVYRALKADPKDARRANVGSRRTGKM
jgi:putative ubiquitin-RnfH superfamily antitoxin RatB of RatAB toxin-antitoxin module